ncbi:MAG: Imm8 family immunity protein [Pirellulaceae bacterium]
MQAEIHQLESNDHVEWNDFVQYQSPDPYDDYGWFHVTIGATGVPGGNDFQVCVATPRAVGRIKRDGFVPGILVDQFDAATVEKVIRDRVESVRGHSWDEVVNQLRDFMRWEYEGMAGS